jgi:hypothetical protein
MMCNVLDYFAAWGILQSIILQVTYLNMPFFRVCQNWVKFIQLAVLVIVLV